DDRPAVAPVTVGASETASTVPTTAVTVPSVSEQPPPSLAVLEAPTASAETPAVATVRNVCVSDPDYCSPPPTEAIPTPYGTRCSEWWDLAETVGWPRSQLSKMGA